LLLLECAKVFMVEPYLGSLSGHHDPRDSSGGVIDLIRTKGGRGLVAFFIVCSTAGAFAGWSAYTTQPTESPLTGAQFEPVERPVSATVPLISNREAKGDRLVVARMVLASADATVLPLPQSPLVTPVVAVAPPVAATPPAAAAPVPPAKRKAAPAQSAAPAPKAQTLDESQIAHIKTRLRLTPSQEQYWPAVEQALRDVLRQQAREARRTGQPVTAAKIDVNSPEVQRLTWAAMPLLYQLREDQKHEVRKFARTIGLTNVASQI
jgi:hypothetical protein